ncbi:Hypothetical protein GbCGDNIH1_5025 [Granulibacter bethesdensis CGDNIH1]|uniref:Uncharacterized protein n=1 Tax=Granulibacter bethesdensis (strain ATCC BAA-1260 / CGDNIH1) TaxID=391165 RepID=A0A286M2X4_GRABC|nr:Hypothetical protein GbCGDNIH5_5025 [Granulibacter bethesdensis]APH63989.1 Hypothetical protein GbCGDNIH1I4_5025 [Granulibacter bethesdensis]ASV62373.1 Hypothetical protein GbCGDNIH1_5025 [Granulibacter bethesdensis CGDNIH1]
MTDRSCNIVFRDSRQDAAMDGTGRQWMRWAEPGSDSFLFLLLHARRLYGPLGPGLILPLILPW